MENQIQILLEVYFQFHFWYLNISAPIYCKPIPRGGLQERYVALKKKKNRAPFIVNPYRSKCHVPSTGRTQAPIPPFRPFQFLVCLLVFSPVAGSGDEKNRQSLPNS